MSLPSKFLLPEKTEWMRLQNLHEPTRSYGQEIYDIVAEFPYKNALEIGCTWGVSTLAILKAGKGKLTSVDPIPITHEDMHAPVEVQLNDLLSRWNYQEMRSDKFWEDNTKTYDLIYIDGSHLYDDFRNDIFEAWKVLKPNGLIICDDICHKANKNGEYGVSLAAWEFIKELKIEHIHTTTRLLYIYKAEN